MTSSLAPIALFVYNRLPETIKTINALRKNHLAPSSLLYIFSDAPKNEDDNIQVRKVRKYLKSIDGFKDICIDESESNLGLANSIIKGVNKVLSKHESIIVLEDDLVSSSNFLDFMNQALDFYKNNEKIFSISGYTFPLKYRNGDQSDIYFGYRASSWGWGTWERNWKNIDWSMKSHIKHTDNKSFKKKLSRGGQDMVRMLKMQMAKKIDSWAIRWCFHQTLYEQYTVFPKTSKIYHIGGGKMATHVSSYHNRLFHTKLDDSSKTQFSFLEKVVINPSISHQFKHKFSYKNKLINYLKHLFNFQI